MVALHALSAVNLKLDQGWSTSERRFSLIRIEFIEFRAQIVRPLHLIRLVSRDMVKGVGEIWTILADADRSIIDFHRTRGIRCIIVLVESRRISIRKNRPRSFISFDNSLAKLYGQQDRPFLRNSRKVDYSFFISKNC